MGDLVFPGYDANQLSAQLSSKRNRVIGLTIFFAVMTVAFVLVVISGTSPGATPIIGTLLFSGLTALGARAGKTMKNAIEFGKLGLRLPTGELIEWDNIAAMDAGDDTGLKREPDLCIRLKDVERYLQTLDVPDSALQMNRALLAKSVDVVGYHITINSTLTGLSLDELIDVMMSVAARHGYALPLTRRPSSADAPALPTGPQDAPRADVAGGQWPALPDANTAEPVIEP